jgi:Ni/Co efflux regulator RcnB
MGRLITEKTPKCAAAHRTRRIRNVTSTLSSVPITRNPGRQEIDMKTKYALAFIIVGILASGQVFADKPATAGANQNSEQRGQPEQAQGKKPDTSGRQDADQRQDADKRRGGDQGAAGRGAAAGSVGHGHFGDQQRNAVREYYSEEFRHGRCPPGLAKKENGCMPPGLAKNWAVGQQLPRDVVFHNLPETLATQLGQPPAGHRYVRAADDILLINSGTGLVIDAIPGLGMR